MLLKLNLIDLVVNDCFSQIVRSLIWISFVILRFAKMYAVYANIFIH